jgi:hypothetical protein
MWQFENSHAAATDISFNLINLNIILELKSHGCICLVLNCDNVHFAIVGVVATQVATGFSSMRQK